MRFSALTVAALAVSNGNVSAFTVSLPVCPSKASSRLPFSLNLLESSGGMVELQEFTENDTKPLSKQVRRSPSFWKLAGVATIPISAALGFGLVPSRNIAANAVGAIATGIAGAVGKSRLDSITESAIPTAIAQTLIDHGLEDAALTANHIQELKSKFGVTSDEDFEAMCAEVYSKYLLGMVKYQPQAKTSELKELENLKISLGLSNLQVGEAHAAAAATWFRTTCLTTPEEDLEDPDNPDRHAMDKLLFLTERALKQGGETKEAFNFEMTRTAKAMKLTLDVALERVAEVVEPFYQRALKSTRSKLGTNQVSSAMLERAQKTLGVSEQTAYDMHVACFNEEVRSLLGMDGDNEDDVDSKSVCFVAGSAERLDQLREILGLSEADALYEIKSEVIPFYQATALEAIKDVLSGSRTADDVWKEIDSRRQELLLPEAESKDLVSSMVVQALGGPLEESNKFAKVNNEAATYDNLLETLDAKKALLAVLEKSGWDEFDDFDSKFCDPWNSQSANGFLRVDERMKLYRIFLTRSVRKSEKGFLSDDQHKLILEVKGLLGISDEQADDEARTAFGPELRKVLESAAKEIVQDYTEELAKNMEDKINEVMTNYRLSDTFLSEMGSSFYSKAVEGISEKSPGGIPTSELQEALESLQRLFKLKKEDTYAPHSENFGSVYKKSVLEAMGSTGVIRPEYRAPLDDLRDRLGMREEDTKSIFLEAVEEKMIPMVEWINSEMERTMLTQKQLSERRGKDMGEDVFQSGKGADGVLGLGAEANIMSDIMNLVDFYIENDIAEEKEIGTKEVDGEEVPVLETSYPVTALGSGTLEQEMAEFLYRQFVVGGFTTQGPQGARYEGARATFGGILGLTSETMEEINDNIGSTVYDNFISRSMGTKGTLDQQDMMFLANIQGKLGLTSEQGEKLLQQSQKKVLSEKINSILESPTPQAVKEFREQCNSMGMDLAEDIGISKTRLTRMFEIEVIPGIKNGEIQAENSDILTEIQESLGLEAEECEAMFESVLSRLSSQALSFIVGEMMRGREDNCVDSLKELVRYAAFVDGELGLEVEEPTAYQILNLYEALDFSDESRESVEASTALLKSALGIS